MANLTEHAKVEAPAARRLADLAKLDRPPNDAKDLDTESKLCTEHLHHDGAWLKTL